jgi:hypothetical protein
VPRTSQLLFLAALLSAATLGCSKPAAPPISPVAKATAAANIAKKTKSSEAEQTQPPPVTSEGQEKTTEQPDPPPSEPSVASASPKSPAPSPQPPTPPPPAPPERIALLTPGGPLLVDVRLDVDGQSHAHGIEQQLDKLIAAADTDKDERPTWKELLANADFMKSPLANAENATSKQTYDWADQYDLNDNDLVERGEGAAWLGRDAGRSARAFSVRSTRTLRPEPSATSRLWPLLDTDADGRMSAVEIRDAAKSLLALDANDDQTLSAQELLPLRDQLMAADGDANYGRTNSEHFAALHLEPDEDPARLEYLLSDLYSPGQDLTPASFPAVARLGEELDADDDDWISRSELEQLLKLKPHLELSVSFHKTEAPGGREATVTMDQQSAELIVVSQSPSRIILSLAGMPIILSAHELTAGYMPQQTAMYGAVTGDQIRLLVHDQTDAVFAELDANSDARLSERELKAIRHRLRARDVNGDGDLADEELPYSMIVAFVRGEAANEQGFYVPATPAIAASGPQPPTWFTRADLNADGEISRREFLGAPDQLSNLDLSRDGFITPDEATETSAAP